MGQILCTRCTRLNPSAATFCEYCGNSLAARKKTLKVIWIMVAIFGGILLMTILFIVVVFLYFFLAAMRTFH
jgi:ribosomal protein L40E